MGLKTKAEQPEPLGEREKVSAQFRERGDDPTRSPSTTLHIPHSL